MKTASCIAVKTFSFPNHPWPVNLFLIVSRYECLRLTVGYIYSIATLDYNRYNIKSVLYGYEE